MLRPVEKDVLHWMYNPLRGWCRVSVILFFYQTSDASGMRTIEHLIGLTTNMPEPLFHVLTKREWGNWEKMPIFSFTFDAQKLIN